MNLLPKTEKENLKKGLKLRFVVSALFLLSASFLIGFILLLPSYFLASSYFSKATSPEFTAPKSDVPVEEILNLPAEVGSKLSFFQSNINDVSVADYFSKIVSYLPEGVRLNSVSFSKNQNYKEKNGIIILISGVAANRDSLVSFSTILEKSNLFSTVEVPVSSLTKDKNLPFSMNIFIENSKGNE
jgi:hypothetical protein